MANEIKIAFDEDGKARVLNEDYTIYCADKETFEKVKEAVEKQMPKKPVEKTLEYDGYYGLCPCCNIIVSESNSFRRCRNCGQALDWSDTE